MSTKTALPYTDFRFKAGYIVMLGLEPSGVPDHAHDPTDERLIITMPDGGRRLNGSLREAMVPAKAVR